jgi:S1-C subfamily serine protease
MLSGTIYGLTFRRHSADLICGSADALGGGQWRIWNSGKGESLSGPTLGLSVRAAGQGLEITDIDRGSAASKANLRIGDILQKVADQKLSRLGDIGVALSGHLPGETVDVQLLRGGKPHVMRVEIGGF